MPKFYLVSSLCLLLSVSIGCDQKLDFQGTPKVDSVFTAPEEVPVCRPGEVAETKPTRLILVVDQSGSNATGPHKESTTGTDPQKGLRYSAMAELLQLHGNKSHVRWSLITFQLDSARALTRVTDDQSPVLVSGSSMGSALASFMALHDGGQTPYLPALEMVRKLIKTDREANPDAQYRIAFITDGYPTDMKPEDGLNKRINRAVEAIVELGPEQVQLTTVYYGRPDKTAKNRLKLMAAVGGGEFVDATNSQDIRLNDVIKVPISECKVQ